MTIFCIINIINFVRWFILFKIKQFDNLNLVSWGDNNWYFFLKNPYFWLLQIKILCTINIWHINSAQKLNKLREYLKFWIACHGGTIDSLKMFMYSFQNVEIAFLLIALYVWNMNNLLILAHKLIPPKSYLISSLVIFLPSHMTSLHWI